MSKQKCKELNDPRVLTDVGDVPIQEIRDCGVEDDRLMHVISESVKTLMEEIFTYVGITNGTLLVSIQRVENGFVTWNTYSHASSFARIMEGGYARILLQVGLRSITKEGHEQGKRFGVEQYEMRTFSKDREKLENLKLGEGVKGVYVSVDVDCLDPEFAPGVSHIEPGGLSFRDVLNILQNLQGDVVAADVVEFNRQRDTVDGMTAMVAAKLVRELTAKISKPASRRGRHGRRRLLDAVPSVRCLVSTAAGVDHIDLAECAHRGVAVANSGTVYSADVADHAVGMLVDVLRRVSAAERFARRRLWLLQDGGYPLASKLGGKRVGIIGLGNIGLLIAKRLEAFGCVVYDNSRRPKDSVSYKYFSNVHHLASESDILVVACALNKETRHIVNKDVLEALGKDGIVINIGRGANIDEAALVGALTEGRIAGAGLEVFENEPKVPVELLSMDNVVLTPRSAVYTMESRSDLCEHLICNLEAFFAGKPLITPGRVAVQASSVQLLGGNNTFTTS
ncbi:unnamed protein product [Miscanthus lutarioriparius]|uniref:Uncharacterized protein n=1 Tax=Miscanthus lutarioriparius TaxID=422564 RepID=A0A811QWV5_9POAL|nr:unnamed protein product [Miscanthus lutarioriparius]